MRIKARIEEMYREGLPYKAAARALGGAVRAADVKREYAMLAGHAGRARGDRELVNRACGVTRVTTSDADRPGYSEDCGREVGRLYNQIGIDAQGRSYRVGGEGEPERREWHAGAAEQGATPSRRKRP